MSFTNVFSTCSLAFCSLRACSRGDEEATRLTVTARVARPGTRTNTCLFRETKVCAYGAVLRGIVAKRREVLSPRYRILEPQLDFSVNVKAGNVVRVLTPLLKTFSLLNV